jgi:hypothetical protein
LICAADVRVEELILFGVSAHGSLIAHTLEVALPVEQVRPFATYSRVSVSAHGCSLALRILTYGVETELSAVLNTVRCTRCELLEVQLANIVVDVWVGHSQLLYPMSRLYGTLLLSGPSWQPWSRIHKSPAGDSGCSSH